MTQKFNRVKNQYRLIIRQDTDTEFHVSVKGYLLVYTIKIIKVVIFNTKFFVETYR